MASVGTSAHSHKRLSGESWGRILINRIGGPLNYYIYTLLKL